MSSNIDEELVLANRKAKRAAKALTKLQAQKEADLKMIAETDRTDHKAKTGARQVWLTAMENLQPTGKKHLHSASLGEDEDDNHLKPHKKANVLSSGGKSTASSQKQKFVEDDEGEKAGVDSTVKRRSVPTAAPLESSTDDSEDTGTRTQPVKSADFKKKAIIPKKAKKSKNPAVVSDGTTSHSSDSSSKKSDESSDDNDDDELAAGGLDVKQTAKQFDNEHVSFIGNKKMAPSASDLFDNNNDIVTQEPHPSKRSASMLSSWNSAPPSSETDGYIGPGNTSNEDTEIVEPSSPAPHSKVKVKSVFSRQREPSHDKNSPGPDVESEEDMPIPMPAKKRQEGKKTKASGKRNEDFKNERPTVADQPSNGQRKKDSHSLTTMPDDSSWPAHACIIPNPAPSGDMKLREQDPLICRLVRDGMEVVARHALTVHAWPDADSRPTFHLEVLLKVTKKCLATDSKVADVIKRIKADEDFAKELGDAMISCLSTLRSPAKMSASTEISGFMLGKGKHCEARVKALLEKDYYIFPGDWAPNNIWKPERNKPFLNDAIVNILKTAFFKTAGGVGYKFQDTYVSTLEGRTEKELPIAMVALGATAMYASLTEWSTGKQVTGSNGRVGIKFEGNLFISTYKCHDVLLRNLRDAKAIGFHFIMSTLYQMVIGDSAEAANEASGALDVIDVSEYV